jgi:hypothetical protein
MGLHNATVAVITLCGDSGPNYYFFNSWQEMFRHDIRGRKHWVHGGEVAVKSGPRIVEGRSLAFERALKASGFDDIEWFLTIDSDMGFEPDTLDRMLEVAYRGDPDGNMIKVLGALCFAGSPDVIKPTVYTPRSDVAGYAPRNICELTRDEESGRFTFAGTPYPRDQLVKTIATGAAFMLIHRDVVVHMTAPHPDGFGSNPRNLGASNPYPWYAEGVDEHGRAYGEDIVFCQRAMNLRYPIYVDTRIKIDHYKEGALLNERTFDDRLKVAFGDDWERYTVAAPQRQLVLP